MKPILLLSANFLREHRWPVLILFGWIVLLALASGNFGRGRPAPDDVVFFLVQQAVYISIFSSFLAADAIHNDRKSKRILLVLSKAVGRATYLLATIVGTCIMAVAYALAYGLCGIWLTARATLPSADVWSMMLLVIVGSVLAAAVAQFFSTFLNPYLSVAATLLVFAGPGAIHAQRHLWSRWLPGFPVLLKVINFRFNAQWSVGWGLVALALLQAMVFWMAATTVFNHRDIAVPVE